MRLSALSQKIWVLETLPLEKPGFFLNEHLFNVFGPLKFAAVVLLADGHVVITENPRSSID